MALTVTDLRKELKNCQLSTTGKKHELIPHLEADILKVDSSIDIDINCKCGIKSNDGQPMLQCQGCKLWSHIKCYDLTEESAKQNLLVFSVALVMTLPVRSIN